MTQSQPSSDDLSENSASLLADALNQGAAGWGSRFFSADALAAVPLREQDGVVQVYCLKRHRWLKAKPEEIVRQLVLRWIVNDLGYSLTRIAVEWAIQMGSDAEREKADIVVFSDDANTDPYIIFEVKRPLVTDGVEQLRSYLRWTGCFFGCWCNGDDAVSLLREEDPVTAKAPYRFRDIPRVPNFAESLDEVLKPLTPEDLRPIQDLRGLVQRLALIRQ
jgi:type I restriction enzyme M protein